MAATSFFIPSFLAGSLLLAGAVPAADSAVPPRGSLSIVYHLSTNYWLTPLDPVVSNTLTLIAPASNGIIAYARAPVLRSNTLYSLSLIYSHSATGNPGTVLIDFFKQDQWDTPEHDWHLKPGRVPQPWQSGFFVFNSLSVPTGSLLRIIAPGCRRLQFRDLRFRPYLGDIPATTTKLFSARSSWDHVKHCRFSDASITLFPTNSGMFLVRDHLQIDPSNSYVLSLHARASGRPNERESLYLDLFQGGLYDSPEAEIKINGADLSSQWQTFSQSFCASNIPRSVSLRLFGVARTEIQFKDISLIPGSNTAFRAVEHRHASFSGLSLNQLILLLGMALAIVMLLLIVSVQPASGCSRVSYAALSVLSIIAVIAGSAAYGRVFSHEIILQLGTMLLLLLVCGWWLARLVLPRQYRHFTCLAALPFGFGVLTAGMAVAGIFLPYPYAIGAVGGVALCADLVVFTTVAHRRFGLSSESCVPLSVCALSFLCLAGPLKSRPPEGLYSDCIDGLINCTGAEYVKQVTDRYSFDADTIWTEHAASNFRDGRIQLAPGSSTVYCIRHSISLLPLTRYRLGITARSSIPYPGNELVLDLFHDKQPYPPDAALLISNTPFQSSWRTYYHEFSTGLDPPLVSMRLHGNLFTTIDVQRVTLTAVTQPLRARRAVQSYHACHHRHAADWHPASLSYGAHHLNILDRPGTAWSLAVVSSLLNAEAHEVYRVWQIVLFVCIPLVVYCLVRILFSSSVVAGWVAAMVCAASPLLAYSVQNNSLAQVQGMLLLMALSLSAVLFIAAVRRPRFYTLVSGIACLVLLYTLYLTYMKMLVYVIALLSAGAVFAGLQALYSRFKWLTALLAAAGGVLTVVAVIALSSHPLVRSIMIDQKYPGDVYIMLSPWLLGTTFDYLAAAIPGRAPVLPLVPAMFFAAVLFLIAFSGLVLIARRSGWYVVGWALSLLALFFVASHYIRNPYLVKKHLSICIPFISICAGIGFAWLSTRTTPVLKWLAITVVSLCLAAGYYAIWVTGAYWAYENWYLDNVREITAVLTPHLRRGDTVFVKTSGADEQYLYLMRHWQCMEIDSWKAENTRFAIVDDYTIRRYHRLWIADPSLYDIIGERDSVKILKRKP